MKHNRWCSDRSDIWVTRSSLNSLLSFKNRFSGNCIWGCYRESCCALSLPATTSIRHLATSWHMPEYSCFFLLGFFFLFFFFFLNFASPLLEAVPPKELGSSHNPSYHFINNSMSSALFISRRQRGRRREAKEEEEEGKEPQLNIDPRSETPSTELFLFPFFGASLHLHKRICPSVRMSIHPYVR